MRYLIAAVPILVVASSAVLESITPFPDSDAEERRICQERTRALAAVCRARQAAIDDFLAHRTTLEETVQRFREIARDDPFDVVANLRLCYPGESEEELYHRHVANYLNSALSERDRNRRGCKVSP